MWGTFYAGTIMDLVLYSIEDNENDEWTYNKNVLKN